ncbi:hypothetical protein K474DRAFT_469189 [Panus rudis PR-1116 ss-1]|nr:hypothetical protein K474DRAFT_469189 [Panus rudis PR-1116 ss-1]
MYPDGYDWATSQFGADFPLFQADSSMVSCGLSTPWSIPAMTTAVGYASTSQGTSSMASPTLHMPIPRYPAPQGVPQYDSHETEHRSKLAEFLEPSPSDRSVMDLLRPEWVEHYWREYIAGRLDYQLVCGYMERPYSLNPEDIWNGLANMLSHGVLPPVADAAQYWLVSALPSLLFLRHCAQWPLDVSTFLVTIYIPMPFFAQ